MSMTDDVWKRLKMFEASLNNCRSLLWGFRAALRAAATASAKVLIGGGASLSTLSKAAAFFAAMRNLDFHFEVVDEASDWNEDKDARVSVSRPSVIVETSGFIGEGGAVEASSPSSVSVKSPPRVRR